MGNYASSFWGVCSMCMAPKYDENEKKRIKNNYFQKTEAQFVIVGIKSKRENLPAPSLRDYAEKSTTPIGNNENQRNEIDDDDIIDQNESDDEIIDQKVTQTGTDGNTIFDQKFIYREEDKVITFTKDGILYFFSYIIKKLGYEEKINEKDLFLEIESDGSSLSKSHWVTHSRYIFPQSSFEKVPSIKLIAEIIFKPEYRKKWDDNLRVFEIKKQLGQEVFIVHTISKRQMMTINESKKEREYFTKRFEFYQNEIYYSFSSSIPKELYESDSNAERVRIFFNCYTIKKEKNNFIIDVYNQDEIQMNNLSDSMKDNFKKEMRDMNKKMVDMIKEKMK